MKMNACRSRMNEKVATRDKNMAFMDEISDFSWSSRLFLDEKTMF